jgi:hypothetical protein
MIKPHQRGRPGPNLAVRRISAAIAAACAAFASSGATAFEIDTGNPELTIRLDNTLRFNYATRVESRDDKIGNSAVSDEGTYSFDRGDAVATRFDLLTELDVVFRKRFRRAAQRCCVVRRGV